MNLKELEKALNQVPDFEVVRSSVIDYAMDGSKNTIFVWIKCHSIKSLNIFMWAFCRRWGQISTNWRKWWLEINNSDTDCQAEYLSLVLKGYQHVEGNEKSQSA
jgi:hypothetical protein